MTRSTCKQLEIPVQPKVAGKYRLQVRRPDGTCRHDTGWFDNLITDGGLEHMGTTNGYLLYVSVGSGSGTPAVTDTGLGSFIAATNSVEETTNSAEGTAPYFSAHTKRWRFAAGDATGNISEVGVGPNDTGTSLFSRALVTDGGGSPTTITVLADEFLDVTYQLQVVPPTGDTSVTVVDSGPDATSHDLTIRAANVTSTDDLSGWEPPDGDIVGSDMFSGAVAVFDGAISTITGQPAGSSTLKSMSVDAYVGASLERTGDAVFGLNDGNFGAGGITAIRFAFPHGGGCWQASLTPAIPKTNTDTLTLSFKTSWTRTTAL